MLWKEYLMNDHCPEYEELTIEEKLLVDREMKEWFRKLDNLCVPTFIFKVAEERIIEKLKEKNDRRNRKQSASRRNNK